MSQYNHNHLEISWRQSCLCSPDVIIQRGCSTFPAPLPKRKTVSCLLHSSVVIFWKPSLVIFMNIWKWRLVSRCTLPSITRVSWPLFTKKCESWRENRHSQSEVLLDFKPTLFFKSTSLNFIKFSLNIYCFWSKRLIVLVLLLLLLSVYITSLIKFLYRELFDWRVKGGEPTPWRGSTEEYVFF